MGFEEFLIDLLAVEALRGGSQKRKAFGFQTLELAKVGRFLPGA